MKDIQIFNPITHENIPEKLPELGEWYHINVEDENDKECIFGCVIDIGSNYVVVDYPGNRFDRFHIDKFLKISKFEPDPDSIIDPKIAQIQQSLTSQINEMQRLIATASPVPSTNQTENALVPLSQAMDIVKYKADLITIRDKSLPEIQEKIKNTTNSLTNWIKAKMMPIKASLESSKNKISLVNNQIFNIELYVGLLDNIAHIKKGSPADQSEKINIFQRTLYADEESLEDYEAGGLRFDKLYQFERWLKKPLVFNRVFPFPKTIVAFRIRRQKAVPEYRDFVSFQIEDCDKYTFLYVRNGDNLYRLQSEIDFSPNLFPSKHEFDTTQPLYASGQFKVNKIITENEYLDLCQRYDEYKKEFRDWKKNNPESHPIHFKASERRRDFSWMDASPRESYKKVDNDNTFKDEVLNHIDQQIREYNRIILILQGILDRSEILNPQPQIRLYESEDFVNYVNLIYDESNTLNPPDKPDIVTYLYKKNEVLKPGDIVTGANIYWEEEQAKKENARQQRDWRIKNPTTYNRFVPFDKKGPGRYARVSKISNRTKIATISWTWEKEIYKRGYGYVVEEKESHIRIPFDRILNVSEYESGEYKQFYNDPRTRIDYVKWAPLLLAAEDHVGGKPQPEE